MSYIEKQTHNCLEAIIYLLGKPIVSEAGGRSKVEVNEIYQSFQDV